MGIKQEVDRTWFILFRGPSDYSIGNRFHVGNGATVRSLSH